MRKVTTLVLVALLIVGAVIGAAGCATSAPATAVPTKASAPAPTQASAPAGTQAATSTPSAPAQAAPAAGPATPTKTLDVGFASVLTGPAAVIGTGLRKGFVLAVEDQNAKGGVTIGGEKYKINVIEADTKGDPAVGKTVAENLVYEKKVKLVAGPYSGDAITSQAVYEANKVLLYMIAPMGPGTTGPDKPYTFFFGRHNDQQYAGPAAYTQAHYPEAKRVVTIMPDVPHAAAFEMAAKKLIPKYGMTQVALEKVPVDTQDFNPVIGRILAQKPDVVDTSNMGATMGAGGALFMKQLRQAGYNGIIWTIAPPPLPLLEQMVPPEQRDKIISNELDINGPIVTPAWRDVWQRIEKKYPGEIVIEPTITLYDATMAFFSFLDGQKTLDGEQLMQGFAKYKWKTLWGTENTWVGKPTLGIDRMRVGNGWVSEFINGKMVTKWEAPPPMDTFVAQ